MGHVSTGIMFGRTFLAYLVTHGESTVVRRWQPHVANKCNVGEIDNVQPSVKDEPSCLPVLWNKVGVVDASECDTIEEEESEYDSNAHEDTDPKLAVHACLDVLLTLCEILDSVRQGVKSPHVETSKCSGKRQDHKENNGSCVIRGDCQTRDGVNETKDEMGKCEPANVDHRLSKSRFDNSVAHADDQEQEERERVTACVQNCDDNHQHFRADVASIAVLVVEVKPCHQHLDDQKYDDSRNIVLDSDYKISVSFNN